MISDADVDIEIGKIEIDDRCVQVFLSMMDLLFQTRSCLA